MPPKTIQSTNNHLELIESAKYVTYSPKLDLFMVFEDNCYGPIGLSLINGELHITCEMDYFKKLSNYFITKFDYININISKNLVILDLEADRILWLNILGDIRNILIK